MLVGYGHALERVRIEGIQARARMRERPARIPDPLSSPCLALTTQANVMVDGNHFRNTVKTLRFQKNKRDLKRLQWRQ